MKDLEIELTCCPKYKPMFITFILAFLRFSIEKHYKSLHEQKCLLIRNTDCHRYLRHLLLLDDHKTVSYNGHSSKAII